MPSCGIELKTKVTLQTISLDSYRHLNFLLVSENGIFAILWPRLSHEWTIFGQFSPIFVEAIDLRQLGDSTNETWSYAHSLYQFYVYNIKSWPKVTYAPHGGAVSMSKCHDFRPISSRPYISTYWAIQSMILCRQFIHTLFLMCAATNHHLGQHEWHIIEATGTAKMTHFLSISSCS
jgi:hypothetical protein